MNRKHLLRVFILGLLAILPTLTLPGVAGLAVAPGAVQEPVLKWQGGGCYSSWCETGWYSSPAVADLDGNGTKEVIGSAYSIVVLNGANGSLQWRMRSGHDRSEDPDNVDDVGRTWPGIVVADVDDDGLPEIVTAHGGGYVSVYDEQGYFQSGWPQQPVSNELRGLGVLDLDGDGSMEIVATAARGNAVNTWVYQSNGTLRGGWPQLSNDSGYAWGVYNDNAGLGDIDGDGLGELVIPSDVHYINAYEANGVQIPANSIYGAGEGWGKVGVHVDHAVDLVGYANCGVEHRPNFANSPASLVDVNGDGTLEIIVVGNVYNCGGSNYTDLYEMPFIFNADRTRWSGNGFNWTAIPIPDGGAAPLSEDYNVIESHTPNSVIADLDGDGFKEILYPSYDGRLHAYWLDKTEHGNWPYEVTDSSEGFYRFASEPAVADLDDDGQAEVIFTSWTEKGSNQGGQLLIVNSQGGLLYAVDLPASPGGDDWEGALAAPTLANIDADADLEVMVNTAHAGLAAYDLPGTANARLLWQTGRGNYQRTGSLIQGTLQNSIHSAAPLTPQPGGVFTYTIVLKNPGPVLPSARLTDTLPSEVSFAGNLTASSGSAAEAGNVVTWSGAVQSGTPVTIRFAALVDAGLTDPTAIINTAQIDDGEGTIIPRQATIIVGGQSVYLPLVRR